MTRLGLVVDRSIGRARPVVTGSVIDDGLGNGALLGAFSGMGIALVDASLRCGPRPDRVPCTRKGILRDILSSARWMAIVGLLIDAAIPPSVQGPESAPGERSQRRLGANVNVRF